MSQELHHTSEEHYDVSRKRKEDHFEYHWKDGKGKVENQALLNHIEGLVIPPMWEDVLICSNDCGHIQAIGYDQKKRKQYIYHEKWKKQRNQKKYEKLVDFARILPTIRRKAHKDIDRKKWVKNKALGLAILMLDETHIRIGNAYYEAKNGTYGLTTLRRKHLEILEEGIKLEYKAKSNRYRKVSLKNNELVKLIKRSSELPGYEIFRYKDGLTYQDITSTDVNAYLHEITNKPYSAKDFRTWGGTTMAVEFYPEAKEKVGENQRLKLTTTLVKLVAEELGNTPATCREYYIHPAVIEAVKNEEDKKLSYKKGKSEKYELSEVEKTTLNLIS